MRAQRRRLRRQRYILPIQKDCSECCRACGQLNEVYLRVEQGHSQRTGPLDIDDSAWTLLFKAKLGALFPVLILFMLTFCLSGMIAAF